MIVHIPGQQKVLDYYGYDAQTIVHMEEFAELIQAVSKMRRARKAGADDTAEYYNLVEEMADSLICMEQIQEMYDIPNQELQAMVARKCARTQSRLQGNQGWTE